MFPDEEGVELLRDFARYFLKLEAEIKGEGSIFLVTVISGIYTMGLSKEEYEKAIHVFCKFLKEAPYAD
jgi:hypothetical protein